MRVAQDIVVSVHTRYYNVCHIVVYRTAASCSSAVVVVRIPRAGHHTAVAAPTPLFALYAIVVKSQKKLIDHEAERFDVHDVSSPSVVLLYHRTQEARIVSSSTELVLLHAAVFFFFSTTDRFCPTTPRQFME